MVKSMPSIRPTSTSRAPRRSRSSGPIEKAGPVLLEPIMKVEVVTPEEYYGAINGDLMGRAGHDHRDQRCAARTT